MKIKIIQPKLKGKKDSFFYEGEIATITKKNKTVLSLIASGFITINILGKRFSTNHIQDAIEEFKLTDKKLKELVDKGSLEWIENNWFEVIYLPKGADGWDCVLGDVAYSYNEGIELLKSYYKDKKY